MMNNTSIGLISAGGLARFSPSIWVTVLLLVVVTLALTRKSSARSTTSETYRGERVLTVARSPYWIPLLGHLPSLAWNAAAFTRGLRQLYERDGVFALSLGGATHNIIFTPGLTTALLRQSADDIDHHYGTELAMRIFGMPARDTDRYLPNLLQIATHYKMLLTDPHLGEMVRRTARLARSNLPNLVTFTRSPVDEMPWERAGGAVLATNKIGDSVVEASLLALVRDFVGHTANPSVMGSDFLTNYPEFFDDLWTFDRGFMLLGTGLPRWFPWPPLTRTHIARRRMLKSIAAFHVAMAKEADGKDPGKDWSNLDDVSPLVKARTHDYRRLGWKIDSRAVIELSLIWATNANSNSLIFWMLTHIYADPQLLTLLREEIAPHIWAVQAQQLLPVAEPPRFERFDVDALCEHSPLLKSCYVESLRVDSASWSLKHVKQDFVLQSRDKNSPSWLLRKGEYAHAAHDLHNTDPAYYEHPAVWKADRHVKRSKDDHGREHATADLGTLRPYGGGPSMCKGRAFAFKECMMFVAGIISLWDMEPSGGGPWRQPEHKMATGVFAPKEDVRVWVKRRTLPQ